MTNQELFKQAIADAKSVRDAAVANAKAALEETFTPKIMSMLSTKLNELEEDMEEGMKEKEEEGYSMEKEGMETAVGYEGGKQKPEIEEDSYEEGAKSMEEMDLEEILAELEKEGQMEEGKKEDMEEAKKTEEEGKEKVDEAEDKEKMEEADDDDEVTELTVDELKDIIRDVLQDVMGGAEAGMEAPDEGGEDTGEEKKDDDESIDLDELLAELDSMEEGKDKEKVEEKKEKEEEGKKMEEAKKEEVEEAKKEAKKAKEDLEEAIKVIKFLKKELNEVNLLNAKNTYVNKIFKAKSLSESQKVNVLKSMDKATNVKEAKVIYESLVSTLSTAKKTSIKESVGFASKAAGVAPKQPIVESDAAIRRMQQLAGIIK